MSSSGHAQQVTAADHAEQAPVLVNDQKQPNVVSVHHPGRAGNCGVRPDRDRRRGHQLARAERIMPPRLLPVPGNRRPPGAILLLQVRVGDHARHLPSRGKHGDATDPVPGQQPDDLLVRGKRIDRHHGRGHHVLDVAPPAPRPRLPQAGERSHSRLRRDLRPFVQALPGRIQRAGHVGTRGPAVPRLVVDTSACHAPRAPLSSPVTSLASRHGRGQGHTGAEPGHLVPSLRA